MPSPAIPLVPVRLIKGHSPENHQETIVWLSRIPAVGEMVQWGTSSEPCEVLAVLHFAATFVEGGFKGRIYSLTKDAQHPSPTGQFVLPGDVVAALEVR